MKAIIEVAKRGSADGAWIVDFDGGGGGGFGRSYNGRHVRLVR